MLECVTGRSCFGYYSAEHAPRCQKCPDLFRCVKYEVDRRAYYEKLLKEWRGKRHG